MDWITDALVHDLMQTLGVIAIAVLHFYEKVLAARKAGK